MKKLKPHKDYDFVDHDKVFVDGVENNDRVIYYHELYYEQEVGSCMLIPFTDKTFTTPKENSEGKVVAEFLYEYGYDVLERVDDYEYDDLF